MLTPRNLVFSGIIVAALTLFAMPLTQVEAQRSTRGGSGGSSGGSRIAPSGGGSRSAPAPSPRASSPAPTPRTASRSVPAPSRSTPAPRASSPSPRASSPSRSIAPSSGSRIAPSRSSSPAPSTGSSSRGSSSRGSSVAPSSGSRGGVDDDISRSTYRSAPVVPRTASGVPTIEPTRDTRSTPAPSRSGTGISRADNISRTASRTPTATAPTRSSLGSTSRDSSTRGDTRSAVAGPSTFTERSTLTSFRGTTGASTFRGDSPAPQERLAGPTPFYSPYGYYGSYYSGYQSHHHSGFGFSWSLGGGWSIGFSSGWYGHWGHHHHWGSNVYHGSFATAILVGTAWHLVAHNGFWGYYGGSNCHWLPYSHYSHCDTYYYGGNYCRVNRPYWLGYSRWYDYRPYGYGYTSLVYEDLYEDGYDDGYDRGYNRGYNDGAEEAGGLKDDRRRDSIGKPNRPRMPDSTADRAKGNALAEYRSEMNRGGDAFNKGDYLKATKAFKEAAILDPESADARYMLAASAMAEGKYAFSAFALRRGMALDAKGSNLDLPKMYGGPDAVKAQREAIQRDLDRAPDDADLLLLKGFVALRSGDAATAAEALDKALQHNPQDAAAKHLHKEALDALENS